VEAAAEVEAAVEAEAEVNLHLAQSSAVLIFPDKI
jgi:hypothetical protein